MFWHWQPTVKPENKRLHLAYRELYCTYKLLTYENVPRFVLSDIVFFFSVDICLQETWKWWRQKVILHPGLTSSFNHKKCQVISCYYFWTLFVCFADLAWPFRRTEGRTGCWCYRCTVNAVVIGSGVYGVSGWTGGSVCVTCCRVRSCSGAATQPWSIILSDNDEETELIVNLETLAQAAIIFIMGVAIIVSNVLIIATYLNYRGQLALHIDSRSYTIAYCLLSIPLYSTSNSMQI